MGWAELAPGVRLDRPLSKEVSETMCGACRDAHQTVLTVFEFYRLSGMTVNDGLREPLVQGWQHYRKLAEANTLMDDLKWRCAAMCSMLLGQDLPKRPDTVKDGVITFLGGRFYSFTQRMKRACRLRTQCPERRAGRAFAWGVNQLKKGFPRPGRDRLKLAEAGFCGTMSAVQDRAAEQQVRVDLGDQEVVITLEDLRKRVCAVVDEMHAERPVGRFEDYRRLPFPSVRAHFNNPRKTIGALGNLATRKIERRADGVDDLTVLDDATRWNRDEPVSRTLLGEQLGSRPDTRHLAPERQEELADEEAEQVLREQLFHWADVCRQWSLYGTYVPGRTVPLLYGPIEDDWIVPDGWQLQSESSDRWRKSAYWRLVAGALDEMNSVSPVALAEACKVRTISTGPVSRYTWAHAAQKWLFDFIADRPYIGSDRYLDGYELSKRISPLEEGEVLLSGDFKAATDNIHAVLSEAAVHRLSDLGRLAPVERSLFLDSLTRHWCVDKKEGRASRQGRGQLMGSPTSFPILCIINLALAQLSRELAVKEPCPLSGRFVVVNGDDVLLKLLRAGVRGWELVCGLGGLQSSVGKTFFSDEWCTINSTFFEYKNAPQVVVSADGSLVDEGRFTRIPFINMGLLMGFGRSSCDGGAEVLEGTLGARCRWLLDGFHQGLRQSLFDAFLAFNKRHMPAHVPWFVPEVWGGLGLPAEFRRTDDTMDRRVLAGIQARGERLPGKEVPKLDGVRNRSERILKKLCGTISGRSSSSEAAVGVGSFYLLETGSWCVPADCEEEEAAKKSRLSSFWLKNSKASKLRHAHEWDETRLPEEERINVTVQRGKTDALTRHVWFRALHMPAATATDAEDFLPCKGRVKTKDASVQPRPNDRCA